ncbi:MAG: nucleoside phosphorylase [Candidatus Thermoplasmatota archaeon]|nr:nucleoside phosphorylase [Euryarchaeota archaeon]MBU4032877.1 nucleoside phosphorylase [Candidatus Thermoplasmatota archaeon]MBU4072037.1 nucleoside phosphorylase [Candidatus Thermoplasmatota archaeon]MBU4144568.1 nucleoside phosphorylase [Candidatus Thermoplasmatota archaeon]MBU4592117.1 nucleoside phosphorylase [Candidatus Thermoplasmatota archaeon]
MVFPNYPNKQSEKALFSPSDFMEYAKKRGQYPTIEPPDGLILCYDRNLLAFILANHKTTVARIFGEVHVLDETEGKIAIASVHGIGGPCAVTTMEEKIAFGINKFISIGLAGSLQKSIGIGDIVVCDRAIRDEGVSHHYLESSKYAHASEEMTKRIKSSLDKLGIEYVTGTSWTTDAVYRETTAEVSQYQKDGVATVEMEAAALFAVAQYRKVQIGSILTISDSLADMKWQPEFHSENAKTGLENLFKAAVNALLM